MNNQLKSMFKWSLTFTKKVITLVTILWIFQLVYSAIIIWYAVKTQGSFSYLDTFINDNNGIIVEPENIEQLSKALVEMANNLNKYNSSDIINYCDKNFSEEAICDKIISIYKEVK